MGKRRADSAGPSSAGRGERLVNIFFDVDNTIITWDVKLRPGVHEVFTRLREDGHTIYLWSGMGPRWEVVQRFDLHEHVIDDHVEIIHAFTGSHVPEPMLPLDRDKVMWRVYDEITAHVSRTHLD